MFEFNDPRPIPFEMMAIGSIFVGVAVIVGIAAYCRAYRERYVYENLFWLIGATVFSVLAIAITSDWEYRYADIFSEVLQPGLAGSFIILIWFAAALGCIRSWQRRPIPGQHIPSRNGFGVLGPMICILSIVITVLMLFPPVAQARKPKMQRLEDACQWNLKQIGWAFNELEVINSNFPAATSGNPLHSWRVTILSYLGESALRKQYDTELPWDSLVNEPLSKEFVRAYQCPARVDRNDSSLIVDRSGRRYAHYAMVTGPNTVGSGVRRDEIKDGTSSTALVIEACGMNIVWTEPRDIDTAAQFPGVNRPSMTRGSSSGWASSHHHLSSRPNGSASLPAGRGANILLADGTVRFISETIDEKTLRALSTIDQDDGPGEF